MAYSEGLRRGSERKSVSAHPWKLIYDTDADSNMIFNLADDPGELEPIIGTLPESIPFLEYALMRNLIKMQDTWFVDMVPGRAPCEFGLRISVEQELSRGVFTFCRYITADGAIREPRGAMIERSRLTAVEPALIEPLTLVFQVDAPPGMPVTFDFSINGVPAAGQTYLGDTLIRPESMPFSLYARRKALKADGQPSDDRNPPYFVIRRSKAEQPGYAAASLGADTKEELRALGYIQ